ncbi:hypothetical protein BU17DRAFT_60221 [Hysterangium stoloniferum]|nr:hypothetical protein BU17DRAFT_60221 [Hysterangium stoloniferum]
MYAEKVAKLLVELQSEHAWQLLQQSQVGMAHHDFQVQVYVDSVEAAMVAEVHTGVQEDFYHGKARPQDAQEPKMDHHEMGLHPLEVVRMVKENVHGGQLERSFANAAYTPHLALAGNGVQVFEEDP